MLLQHSKFQIEYETTSKRRDGKKSSLIRVHALSIFHICFLMEIALALIRQKKARQNCNWDCRSHY